MNPGRLVYGLLEAPWHEGIDCRSVLSAVKARITVDLQPTSLVVPLAALQKFRDWDVVFIRVGDDYEVRPVTLGKRDATRVEILDGLKAGDQVVIEQSYLVKADIDKSGASQDH